MAAASSTVPPHRSARCRRLPTRWAIASPCGSTAASAAARACSRRSRSARKPCSSAAPSSMGSEPPAKRAYCKRWKSSARSWTSPWRSPAPATSRARAPRYCATSEAGWIEGAHQRAFERQRLAFELGGDELRGERRPHQPARAVGKGAEHALGDLADHRQPVGRHGPERDTPVHRRAYLDAEDRAQPLEIAGVVFLAQRAL